MSDARPSRLLRFLKFLERLPFQHGQFMMVKMDNDHPRITNRGESDMLHSQVPNTLQLEAIEKENRRRAEARIGNTSIKER